MVDIKQMPLSDEVGRLMKEMREKVKASPDAAQIEEMTKNMLSQQRVDWEAEMAQRKSDFDVSDFINDGRGISGYRNDFRSLINKSTTNPKIKELQKWNDDVYIISTLLKSKHPEWPIADITKNLKLFKGMREFIRGDAELEKAMTTTATGYGAEWIPTGFSADMIDMVMLELTVAQQHQDIPMPNGIYAMGRKVSRNTIKGHVEAASESSTRLGTEALTLTAKTFMGYSDASFEFGEDSIIPALSSIKADLVLCLGMAQEDCTINGDTSETHQDSDSNGSTDYRKLWKGYRKSVVSGAKKDAGGDALTEQDLKDVRRLMGVYSKDTNQLFFVFGINVMHQFFNSTNFPSLQTLEKMGPNALILKGEIGKVWNIPVLISEYIRENVNSSGNYDGSVTTLASGLLVRKDAFLYGSRRGITIELDREIKSGTTDIVATRRQAFAAKYKSTDTFIGMIRNILTAG